jgi:predicted glycosyltransferase
VKTISQSSNVPKRIWIDLDNSPHVPFFAPIVAELERRGYCVTVTARDAYQVLELAQYFNLSCTVVGRHYGKRKLSKVLGTCFRVMQLMMIVSRRRPSLAIAHGSRSQTLASFLLRIPSLAILDYEFVNTAALLKANWMMVPEVIADSALSFDAAKILKYPGIKEDVYAAGFTPDPSICSELKLDRDCLTVVVRPPATEAHYHKPQSQRLFEVVMELLGRTANVKVILLPRNAKQTASLRSVWSRLFDSGIVTVPEHAVNGLNLIWHSDLVISGGGTMNREAAALGVPVYSIFCGTLGAVDRYLADSGRLTLLKTEEDVRMKIAFTRRTRSAKVEQIKTGALASVMGHIVSIVESDSVGSLKQPVSNPAAGRP